MWRRYGEGGLKGCEKIRKCELEVFGSGYGGEVEFGCSCGVIVGYGGYGVERLWRVSFGSECDELESKMGFKSGWRKSFVVWIVFGEKIGFLIVWDRDR